MKEIILDIIKGMLIGVANVIPGVSGGTIDDIIRNTLTINNDSNSYNISQDNNLNNGGGYDYSQNNDYNLNEYNQSYDTNNYDGQSNNIGSNDIYNNQSYQMDNNSNAYNNSDFNFDYQY